MYQMLEFSKNILTNLQAKVYLLLHMVRAVRTEIKFILINKDSYITLSDD